MLCTILLTIQPTTVVIKTGTGLIHINHTSPISYIGIQTTECAHVSLPLEQNCVRTITANKVDVNKQKFRRPEFRG